MAIELSYVLRQKVAHSIFENVTFVLQGTSVLQEGICVLQKGNSILKIGISVLEKGSFVLQKGIPSFRE